MELWLRPAQRVRPPPRGRWSAPARLGSGVGRTEPRSTSRPAREPQPGRRTRRAPSPPPMRSRVPAAFDGMTTSHGDVRPCPDPSSELGPKPGPFTWHRRSMGRVGIAQHLRGVAEFTAVRPLKYSDGAAGCQTRGCKRKRQSEIERRGSGPNEPVAAAPASRTRSGRPAFPVARQFPLAQGSARRATTETPSRSATTRCCLSRGPTAPRPH